VKISKKWEVEIKSYLIKIYQELVAIRKELQNIRNVLKPYSVDVFIGDKKI